MPGRGPCHPARMVTDADLSVLDAEQLRALAHALIAQVSDRDSVITRQTTELDWRQGKIDKLTAELALYRRWTFGRRSEALSAEQIRLFDETCAADIAEIVASLAPEAACRQLIELARERDGSDNISVGVIAIQPADSAGEG